MAEARPTGSSEMASTNRVDPAAMSNPTTLPRGESATGQGEGSLGDEQRGDADDGHPESHEKVDLVRAEVVLHVLQ